MFSGTYCIALTTLRTPPTCQERVPHKLQNYLQMFCLLLTAPARWCLLSFAPAVSKQKWKTFCSKRSQQRQTLNVISHQGWAACNSGVFPLPPLHPSRIPSPPPPSTAHLPQWPQGFLSRISDLLLCRWTCRHCCQKCYESSCCQSSEDEVEILGPFPAQTPPWL